ncbi:TetR family transcriptional regulator [uncultured Mycobacterium sp.]|uniref:TetR family transcriptional regulator n=1 Tax=uncultured Mycobacterium sp. TaxID=171292 RepID=UPI0035CC0F21
MLTAAQVRVQTRAIARARLRDLALDAARQVVAERGWGAVRMGAIAAAIGTSRQTLHGEFGTKDELGLALIVRETSAFFDGVAERLNRHRGDLAGAVEDAAAFALQAIADDPLLQTALTGAAGDVSMLPLLTTRSEPLMRKAIDLFGNWVSGQWPDRDPDAVGIMVESVVRLVFSHAMAPTKAPGDAARDVAFAARRFLDA